MEYNYKHDSDHMYEALGLTEDQYDELMFKAIQIMKRHGDKAISVAIEAAVKWTAEKFEDPSQRSIACLMMGQHMEKSRMMASVQEMMSGSGASGGMLSALRDRFRKGDIPGGAMQFETDENQEAFMKEFKELIKEFNGARVDEMEDQEGGFMAIELLPENKEEFHKRLDALKKKYCVEGGEEIVMPFGFGGPTAEA